MNIKNNGNASWTEIHYNNYELSFARLGDPVMTAAMTDRLTHKSYVVNMNGNLYRMKETKAWLNTLEQ